MDFVGSGDSYLIKNVLPEDIARNVYQKVLDEVEFKDLLVNNNPIGREGAFYAQIGIKGEIPILRCPSIEGAEVKQFTPILQSIRDYLSMITNVNINHVKVQTYADNTKGVAPHTDKTLDLAPDSSIVNFRIGATREFILTNKVDGTKQVFDMPHNSIFVLGPKTNVEWLHSVEPREETIGPSISMVFRNSGTFQRQDGHIFGIGARFKTEHELDEYLETKNNEPNITLRKALIRGYVWENQSYKQCRESAYRNVIENTV